MKLLKKLILKWYYKLFPKQQIKEINRKLGNAVLDKSKQRIILLTQIKHFVKNELKIDTKSKHIPLNVRRAACLRVKSKFGERMKALQIKMNINLQLKIS